MAAAAVIGIGLLVFGLLSTQSTMPSSTDDTQEPLNNRNWWTAAPISKETLLLLLAVGIASVLGISRKKRKSKAMGMALDRIVHPAPDWPAQTVASNPL